MLVGLLACPMEPCHVAHVAPDNATNIVFEILSQSQNPFQKWIGGLCLSNVTFTEVELDEIT